MSNKRYRLTHDLIGFKKGDTFTPENGNPEYYNANGHLWHERIHKFTIEANPKSFEEEKKRIEVHLPSKLGTDCQNGFVAYWFTVSKVLDREEFPAIREAIERAVNGDDGKIHFKSNSVESYDGASGRGYLYDELRQFVTPNPRETFEKNLESVNLDGIAEFISKYRHDDSMTSHRIAAHITGNFTTKEMFTQCQMDKAREEGFLAAREKPDPYYNAPEYRYEKVEDYLKKFKK